MAGVSLPYRCVFLLLPGYSQLPFAAAIEPLRLANNLSESALYDLTVASLDGQSVAASNGTRITPDYGISNDPPVDLLVVCGGIDIETVESSELNSWLRSLARRHVALGAVCTGSFVLARAGVMDGYRCTLHWEHISGIRETMRFPNTEFTSERFVMDRDRFTASGGAAPLDMMLHLITRQHGIELAESVSDEAVHERIREVSDLQRIPLRVRLGTSQPKLVEVVTLMESNINEPLSLDELAAYANTSRRQLERLFSRYLGRTPTRYYLELRLTQARQLLLQTDMPITDVAMACGFVSPPHFTKCYHDRHGRSPSAERRARRERLSLAAAALLPDPVLPVVDPPAAEEGGA